MRLMHALRKLRRKEHERRICLAKDAAQTPCSGQIVKAHAISRSGTLRPIAKDGHVLSYEDGIDGGGPSAPVFSWRRHGVARASAFNGFCAHHDKALFSCIEDKAFEATHEQCFALMFRSLAFEHYQQEAGYRFLGKIPEFVKQHYPPARELMQAFAASEARRHAWARRGAREAFRRVSRLLRHGRTEGTEHLVLTYEHPPPFAFAGAFAPFWDLRDETLQVAGPDAGMADYLAVTSITSRGASHVVLSRFSEGHSPNRQLFRQIRLRPLVEAGGMVMEFALEGTGTVFYSPSWIEGLTPDRRDKLVHLLIHGAIYAPGPTPWVGIGGFTAIPRATTLVLVA